MLNFNVLFEPLSKAPKSIIAMSFNVRASCAFEAERLATIELTNAEIQRKYFKQKAVITPATNEALNHVEQSEENPIKEVENVESLAGLSEAPAETLDGPGLDLDELADLEAFDVNAAPAVKAPAKLHSVKRAAKALGIDQPANERLTDPSVEELLGTAKPDLVEVIENPLTPQDALQIEIDAINAKVNALLPGEVLRLDDVSNDAYHASVGVSCSKIKVMIDECPAAYHAVVTGVRERKESAIFNIGSAAHGVILEPHNFERDFIVMPDGLKKPTSAQLKAAAPSEKTLIQINEWNAWQATHGHKTQLTGDQFKAVEMMRDAVMAQSFSRRLVKNGTPEVSFWRRDDVTGMIIKARCDYLLGDLIVDVKTCEDSSPEYFAKHAVKYGYHIQDSFYRHVTGMNEFAFLAVEKKAPCVVTAPLLFSAEARYLGFLQYRTALNRIAECEASGVWPGHAKGVSTMDLPSWESRKISDLEIELDINKSNLGAA